jgi:hypothetical protein
MKSTDQRQKAEAVLRAVAATASSSIRNERTRSAPDRRYHRCVRVPGVCVMCLRGNGKMAAKTSEQARLVDAATREEILHHRPDLRGKSLLAMRRILRREARLALRPRRSIKSG